MTTIPRTKLPTLNMVHTNTHHPSDLSSLSLKQIMETPRYQQYLAAIQNIGKTELHAHLAGAVPLEFLQKNCDETTFSQLSHDIDKIRNGVDYDKAFSIFDTIGKILNTEQRIEEAAFEFCRAQYNDKVAFSELRTGLKNLGTGFEGYLQAVLKGLERGMQTYPIQVNLLLSLRRNTTEADADKTIDLALKYRDKGITGIDVSGNSVCGDAKGIFTALQRAKELKFPVTLHIGENPKETPEQQMKELKTIQPQRIGHGVFLCPEAIEWVRSQHIPVEVCIKSALSVDMIDHASKHPWLKLLQEGHPLVFCTDDATLFGDLSSELALLACLKDLSLSEIIELQSQAHQYAFKH